ncbi:MAG: hypothetical protein OJF52_001600 [Nitrospira sp.]|jgi:hypothetical protein|nr:MAG: hypothetical protein OJF52_001600 [Nitrospira sp.]
MPVNRPSANRSPDGESLELLTKQALEASQAGDWDRVEACYSERETTLKTCVVDPVDAERLIAMDEQVRAALIVAKAGIAGLLVETAQVKRRLRRLRDISGPRSASNGDLHRQA